MHSLKVLERMFRRRVLKSQRHLRVLLGGDQVGLQGRSCQRAVSGLCWLPYPCYPSYHCHPHPKFPSPSASLKHVAQRPLGHIHRMRQVWGEMACSCRSSAMNPGILELSDSLCGHGQQLASVQGNKREACVCACEAGGPLSPEPLSSSLAASKNGKAWKAARQSPSKPPATLPHAPCEKAVLTSDVRKLPTPAMWPPPLSLGPTRKLFCNPTCTLNGEFVMNKGRA